MIKYKSKDFIYKNTSLYFYKLVWCSHRVKWQTICTFHKSPLKNGALKNGLENVPPPLGNKVRKQMRPRTTPHAYRSSPKGVISSVAGTSSPPRKKVANKPQAKQRTLPLNPPIPSTRDVANDSRAAVLLPNMACAMRPPSSLPHGNKFKDVTTIPVGRTWRSLR